MWAAEIAAMEKTEQQCCKCGDPSLAALTDHICLECYDVYMYCWRCSVSQLEERNEQ